MQSRERIIDIKALIRCVVEKWRLLLLVGFLAGVVLAGIKGYSQHKLYKLSQGQQETAAQESGSQKGQILNVMHVAEVEREEYYTNSILGKINPHKEGKATADILVSIPANTAPAAAGGEPAATGGEPAAAEGEPAAAEGDMPPLFCTGSITRRQRRSSEKTRRFWASSLRQLPERRTRRSCLSR